MERYSILKEKFPREIVLLKAFPCKWGRCSFCDYIDDNSINLNEIIETNKEILKNITGKFSRLEVIDSASVFELPDETMEDIKNICKSKNIKELVFEAHWIYKDRLNEIRDFFNGIDIFFKTGLETFDDKFRNKVLNKGIVYKSKEEIGSLFDSACIMTCIKGQTKDMIDYDIENVLKYFKRATINVYNNNSTHIEKDEELEKWFMKKYYKKLKENPRIEILVDITDFGVGEI